MIGPPSEVKQVREAIMAFLAQPGPEGSSLGDCAFGVYAFFDYDEEPIYVGQTREGLKFRICRHLTNQRTDAVAMSVLDPQEVAWIEAWPIADWVMLDAAESTVFEKAVRESKFQAVLNEKPPEWRDPVKLPLSYRGLIIPPALYDRWKHPDVRIARRSATIAALAKVISERKVNDGLRNTLFLQARRLADLTKRRLRIHKPDPQAQMTLLET